MNFAKVLLVTAVLAGGTIFAGYASFRDFGVQEARHPEGIRIRQESVERTHAGLYPAHRRVRSHRGGGLRRGK
ncbi:hypothetical protein ACFL0Q_08835 [Thermodesulfobacteriota bacterium]